MDVQATRRKKLRQLAAQLARQRGSKGKGQSELVEKMGRGWSEPLVSQLIGDNHSKPITDKRARKIEEAFGLNPGWLDIPEGMEAAGQSGLTPEDETLLLECFRSVRAEIARLNMDLTPEDADELLIKSALVLFKFSKEAGKNLPAGLAISSVRL